MTGAELAMVAISAAGTAYSIYSGMEAKDAADRQAAEQERLARENAAAIEAETAENARRLSMQQAEREGMAMAKAAASGVKTSGSTGDYLSDMSTEHKRELDWLKKSGASQAGIAKQSGYTQAQGTRNAGQQALNQGIAGGIKTAGSTMGWGIENKGWFS